MCIRDSGGADVVLEVAGAESTFRLAWECARPNATVTVVALYDKAQTLPLPDMYGKNLTSVSYTHLIYERTEGYSKGRFKKESPAGKNK